MNNLTLHSKREEIIFLSYASLIFLNLFAVTVITFRKEENKKASMPLFKLDYRQAVASV